MPPCAPSGREQAFAAALVEVTKPGATPLDGFLIMHRSGSSERAALLISLVSGVQVMRQMIGLPALAKADPKVLARLLTPIGSC